MGAGAIFKSHSTALLGAFMYHRIATGHPKKGWAEHVVDTLWPAFAA